MMKIGEVLWWVGNLMILNEAMEPLDVGGRHLDNLCIQCGLYEDEKNKNKNES